MPENSDAFFDFESPVATSDTGAVALPQRPSASPLAHLSPLILLKDLKKNILWVLLCAILGTLGGYFLATRIQATYEARTVMIRHVRNTNVNASLYHEPEIRTILETVKLRENLEVLKARLDLEESTETLFKQIEVKPGQRSDIIQILAQAETPEKAAAMAQTMSEIFQSSSAGLSQNVARRVYAFRLSQRKRFEQRLKEAQDALSRFQKKHKVAFFEDSTRLLLEQIKQLELDLERAKLQQGRDKEAIASIAQKLSQRPENIRVTQTVRYRNRVRYQELESELNALLQRYTPENPKVIALQTQMKALTETAPAAGIQEEESYGMDPVVRELKIDQAERMTAMEGHARTIQQLKNQIAAQRQQLNKLATLESDVANLQRHIDRENENLRENDYRLSESENDMEARISAFDILEPATPPEHPLPTRRKLILLMGFVAGTGLGVGSSALRSILLTRLRYPEQITQMGLEDLGVLSERDPAQSLALGYRITQLHKNLPAAEKPALVLVSSPITGQSQAFMAACQQWFQKQERKVAIIQSATHPVLPTHDVGHWLYSPDSPFPLSTQSTGNVSSYVFQKQAQLPRLDKLSAFATQESVEVIFWEIPSPAEAHDLFIQLSAQAQHMIWVLNPQSPHGPLKTWCKEAPEMNHLGVWHETSV